jgi:hypothetical protein
MPLGINYQAVARDKAGNELKNKNLNVRISILKNDATGPIEYAETHSVNTDPFGLFNIIIGQGSWYAGERTEFLNINWGSSPHFLRLEVDFGDGFIAMGTMQFLAVPYALYAASAGNTNGEVDLDKDPENELQILSLEGSVLHIKQGNTITNSVTLGDVVNDADHDPSNEIQTLSLEGYVLQIKQGSNIINSVTLADSVNDADHDPTNEIQTLSLEGNILQIKQGSSVINSVTLADSVNDADHDPTNEIQTLSLEGTVLQIKQDNIVTNSVTLTDVVNDADHDPTNEIQDLSIDLNHKLKITNNTTATTIDLVPYLDNTDNQNLSISGNTLSISDGNSVILDIDSTNELQTLQSSLGRLQISKGNSVNIYDADSSAVNELQDLSLDGYDLSISSGNTVNIRPEIIAVRAMKGYGTSDIAVGDSSYLAFDTPKLNIGSSFLELNGKFTVPENGAGLYSFSITYDYNTDHQLIIIRNNKREEIVYNGFSSGISGAKTYDFLYDLEVGETIQIFVKITAGITSRSRPAVFSGYRIH